ncbi:MAG TPA: hypothetical protein PLL77_16345 [Pyrinomonadaceae bacterium]|nr:hypothetical protein [Pyrinomonadaceae bacterium]
MDTSEYREGLRAEFAENRTGAARPKITRSHSVPVPGQTLTDLAAKVGGSFITMVEAHPEPGILCHKDNSHAQNHLP